MPRVAARWGIQDIMDLYLKLIYGNQIGSIEDHLTAKRYLQHLILYIKFMHTQKL